jgi:hypothetical protein
MGVAGGDIARDRRWVLMSDDLLLPFALRLARTTLANGRQNVGIALTLKLAFLSLAAAGVATMDGVVADTGASLLVTGQQPQAVEIHLKIDRSISQGLWSTNASSTFGPRSRPDRTTRPCPLSDAQATRRSLRFRRRPGRSVTGIAVPAGRVHRANGQAAAADVGVIAPTIVRPTR